MFSFAERFSKNDEKIAPGPGSYTPALVPHPMAASAPRKPPGTIPKDIFHTRYSFLNSTVAGDVVVFNSVETRGASERRGPGAYAGRSLDTFPKKSFNVLAHDSMRHRNKSVLRGSVKATSGSGRMVQNSDSLVLKARDYMGQ